MYQEIFLHTTLRVYPPDRVLEIGWADYVNGVQFRQTIERALELAEQFRVYYWLANDTRLRPLAAPEQLWLLETIIPRLAALKLHRLATIKSLDPATQPTIRSFIERLQAHLPAQVFDHRPAAWAWLTDHSAPEAPTAEGKRVFSATIKLKGRRN